MPLNLKITWGEGASSARLLGLDDATTLGDLKALVNTKTGIDTGMMQFKAGFPPKEVSGSEADPVVKLGITSGSAVTVLERKASTAPAPSAAPGLSAVAAVRAAAEAAPEAVRVEEAALARSRPPAPPASSTRSPPPPPPPPAGAPAAGASATPPGSALSTGPPSQSPAQASAMVQSLVDMGFPQDFATRALEVAGGDINTALEICMGGNPEAFFGDGAGEVGTPVARKQMVRRIIDADNSCLFNAVGYALRRKRKVGSELRQMITEAVRGSPDVYNEGILGKTPEEYCAWISDSKSWGGEIELSILSKKLVVMITVVDIQTNNAYSYGEERGLDRRVFLIYDGVHYDALAEASSETAPEVDDVTVFDPKAADKEDMAKVVAADLKSRNQFTDMGNADLKCMVCLKLLEGQTGALEHARATGHQNFGQI